MLKVYFDLFAATEAQLTPKAIGRLKLASCAALLLMPTVTFIELSQVSGLLKNILMGFVLFALICFSYVAMSRAGNRLWVPDKYLDEGEIQRKRHVGYMTYFWVIMCGLVVMGGLLLAMLVFKLPPINMPADEVLYFAVGNLLMGAICLQTFFTAHIMQPLEADNAEGKPVKSGMDKWYKYFACAFVFLVLILPFLMKWHNG